MQGEKVLRNPLFSPSLNAAGHYLNAPSALIPEVGDPGAAAGTVGSPPEKVTPPRRPKNGFWSVAMRRISSAGVGFPPQASIVSGLAQ